MHVLLIVKRFENNPDNFRVLHKAYCVNEGETLTPYVDRADEAYGELEKLRDEGILADILILQTTD